MIRLWNNSAVILILQIFIVSVQAQNGDIYSEENIVDFAQFLFSSGQYKYAAEEYERLTFMFPEKYEYQTHLLKSYRFAGEYNKGISAYKSFTLKGYQQNVQVQSEYAKLNLLDHNIENLVILTSELEKNTGFQNNLELTLRLVNIDVKVPSLEGISPDLADKGLMNLYYEYSSIEHRSPFLAGTFSAIIPGTGKVYCGRWKDGLIALLFIGGTGFQAYRGFEKRGKESVYGWIMGSISLGFYIGNIYGSVKTARNYNYQQKLRYVEEVTDYYIGRF